MAFLECIGAAAEVDLVSTTLDIRGFYSFPNREAFGSSGFAPVEYGEIEGGAGERDLGSSWGGAGAKLVLARTISVPAFRGNGPLTAGNDVELEAFGELSPVSFSAGLDIGLSPIAFLVASAGIKAGTGWDNGVIGLGINDAGDSRAENFGGLVYEISFSATLRFDLAASMPGAWNHVVLLASPKVEYLAYTGAADGESWIWEGDAGMNFNGWRLKLSGFLGYRMPLALDLLGVLCEAERWIGDVGRMSPASSSGGWGSDAPRMLLGPALGFDLGEGASVAVLLQFMAGPKWSDETAMAEDFRSRDYQGLFWCFHRVAFDITLEF